MTLAAISGSTQSIDKQSDGQNDGYDHILSHSQFAKLSADARDRLVQVIADSKDVWLGNRILAASSLHRGAVYGV